MSEYTDELKAIHRAQYQRSRIRLYMEEAHNTSLLVDRLGRREWPGATPDKDVLAACFGTDQILNDLYTQQRAATDEATVRAIGRRIEAAEERETILLGLVDQLSAETITELQRSRRAA